jgi:hypothetical protein
MQAGSPSSSSEEQSTSQLQMHRLGIARIISAVRLLKAIFFLHVGLLALLVVHSAAVFDFSMPGSAAAEAVVFDISMPGSAAAEKSGYANSSPTIDKNAISNLGKLISNSFRLRVTKLIYHCLRVTYYRSSVS